MRISVADHRRYVDSLRAGEPLARSGVRAAGVTRTVAGERVTYVTTFASEVEGTVVHACATTDLLVGWDEDPTPAGDLVLHVRLDAVEGRGPTAEILSAVGLEPDVVKDLVSGLPVEGRGAAYLPRSAKELNLHLEAWLSCGVPSVALLVRPGDHSQAAVLEVARDAIPWSLRSAVSVIGIEPELAAVCDALLIEHGVAPLQPGTVCVLRLPAHGPVEEHRTVLHLDIERHRSTRLAQQVERGLRLVASDISRTLADPALTGTAHDPLNEAEALAAELDTLRAATELAHEALARAGQRLRESGDRIRDLEETLAASCGEIEPAESGIVPRQASSTSGEMFETP